MSFLTKSGGILGPIATLLGYIMSLIFALLVAINIPNIGLAIVLFTIVIYMLMLPLTYRQQKFSRMTPLMNPELNAIRDKYKGKKDQDSMAKMNEETQQVYAKYGVNPAGSCIQMVITMLILFPLWQVIRNVPAYVSQVKEVFIPLADKLLAQPGVQKYLEEGAKAIQATTITKEFSQNTIIDTLYLFRPQNWADLAAQFPDLSDLIHSTEKAIGTMNNFLGMNIANTPLNMIKEHASVGLVIGAIAIPACAALSQWLSAKLSMVDQQNAGNDQMAGTMKTMNIVMPLMSLVFSVTMPVGMGIYWIMSAVVRTVQTVLINRKLEKTDLNKLMEENMEKLKKKREKKGGVSGEQIRSNTSISTKNINPQAQSRLQRAKQIQKEAADASSASTAPKKNVRPGSLAEKANMVSDYNETHRKK